MASPPSLTLIVAATTKNGIGKAGALPWPMLKREMAYFARITKRLAPSSAPSAGPNSQNVVIMGRKTWDSIPARLRPLKHRTNIVLTRQDPDSLPEDSGLRDAGADVIVAPSIEAGIARLEGHAKPAGRVFVIGGASIYDAALKLDGSGAGARVDRILLTRIGREYECDTFFPVDVDKEGSGWRRATQERLSGFVGEEVEDRDEEEVVDGTGPVRYRFQLYERS